MSNETPTENKSKRPSHYAYRVKEVDGKDQWSKIGSAWAAKDDGLMFTTNDGEKIVLRSREVVDGVVPKQETTTPDNSASIQESQPEI